MAVRIRPTTNRVNKVTNFNKKQVIKRQVNYEEITEFYNNELLLITNEIDMLFELDGLKKREYIPIGINNIALTTRAIQLIENNRLQRVGKKYSLKQTNAFIESASERITNRMYNESAQNYAKQQNIAKWIWFPSEAGDPRASHTLYYNQEFTTGFSPLGDIFPGDEYGCQCSILYV